jgi:hypothetical protein
MLLGKLSLRYHLPSVQGVTPRLVGPNNENAVPAAYLAVKGDILQTRPVGV